MGPIQLLIADCRLQIAVFQSPICNQQFDGPGEIRTRDFLSAIEARSQLRYRPAAPGQLRAGCILPEADGNVKEGITNYTNNNE